MNPLFLLALGGAAVYGLTRKKRRRRSRGRRITILKGIVDDHEPTRPKAEVATLKRPETVGLFAPEVYPEGVDPSGLPPITMMDGFVVAPDCQTIAVGPMWWDSVGERIEELVGSGVDNEPQVAATIVAEFFPEGLDVQKCAGAHAIHQTLLGRIRDYILLTVGE